MNLILNFCKYFLFALLFALPFIDYGQVSSVQSSGIITGKIVDENSNPINDVTIFAKHLPSGSQYYSISINGGLFNIRQLTVGGQYQIIFSHTGYVSDTMEFPNITSDTTQSIEVTLHPSKTSQLSDVVIVVGYGAQNKNKISGAITSVSLDHLSSRSLNDVGGVLQGKATGVVVITPSGDPTATPQVFVRGFGGINGDPALYVVDGSLVTGVPNINPNDIESISVLKDGSAAIYGARASGGVILITTKKGVNGKFNLTLDAKYGTQKAHKLLEALNAKQYADVSNMAADAAGVKRNPAFDATIFPDGQITRTNWINDIFRSGNLQDYSMGLSSGSDRSIFYMAFNYRKAEGILLNTQSQRYNFNIKSEHKITPWFTLGENLYYSYSNGNGSNTSDGYTGAILAAIYYPPNVSPYTADGAYSGLPAQYAGAYGDVVNPVANLKRLDIQNPLTTIVANPYAEIKLLKNLKFRSNLSLTKKFSDTSNFQSKVLEIGKIFAFNQLSRTTGTFTDLLTEQTLAYNTSMNKNHLDAIAGFSYQKRTWSGWAATVQGFANEAQQYRYFINASSYNFLPNDYKIQDVLQSLFARLNYDYDSKYLLSLIGRRDGSSLVSADNRNEWYYSASAGWVISKEEFLKEIDWLSNLKLRGSYGKLGDLASLPPTGLNPPLSQGSAMIGLSPTQQGAYYETLLPNPNLKWAKSKQSDIGLDIGFLGNSLNLTADYFVKRTEGMLLPVPLSGPIGVSAQWQNGGTSQDKGFELGLNYASKLKGPFQYGINGSFTSIHNKLLSLPGGLTKQAVNYNVRGTITPIELLVGQPLYSYFLVQEAGLFQSADDVSNYKNAKGGLIQPNAKPGDIKFIDANNDGKIDNNDRVASGSGSPTFIYNLSLNASYKGFDLNIFFQGVGGNKIFNSLKYTGLNAGVGTNYNMLNGILNAWTPTNTNTNVPRINQADPNANFTTNSTFYLESGAYLRVKNVTLGYTMPQAITQKLDINSVRFYITSNNLFTFTKYSGFDPELGLDQYGIDNARYPQARSFIFGATINF